MLAYAQTLHVKKQRLRIKNTNFAVNAKLIYIVQLLAKEQDWAAHKKNCAVSVQVKV